MTDRDGISYAEFGLAEPFKCGARIFFEEMRHPGAANCACAKFSDGSCVPMDRYDEWRITITAFRKLRAQKDTAHD